MQAPTPGAVGCWHGAAVANCARAPIGAITCAGHAWSLPIDATESVLSEMPLPRMPLSPAFSAVSLALLRADLMWASHDMCERGEDLLTTRDMRAGLGRGA